MIGTRLITVDGMAGTKKTTLAEAAVRSLPDSMGAIFLPEFPIEGIGLSVIELLRRESKNDTAFRTGNSKAELFLFLSLKIMQHRALKHHGVVVEDRGLPSIIGFYLAQSNLRNPIRRFNEMYDDLGRFLTPSWRTIILTGNKRMVEKRLNERADKKYSRDEILIENKLDRLLLEVARSRRNWSILNADGLSKDAAVEKIVGVAGGAQ